MPAPLLTIAVPTYNREADLRRLLDCLDRELAAPGAEGVMVLVSDNASPDGTWALLQEAAATRPWLRPHRQAENLGPVGNLQWLVANASAAEYLWCFGDDDLILPGGLATVVAALREERPAWLFLPHRFVDDDQREVQRSAAPADGARERYATAGALYQAYHHWLTFLTASIVRADAFRHAVAVEDTENEYIPLLWFFRAGLEGPCVVAGEHVVAASQNITWADRAHKIQTLDFTSLWDDGLRTGMTEAEFGATLDGLYGSGWGLRLWRQQPIEQLLRVVARFPQSRGLRGFLWTIAREQDRRDALPVLAQAARATGDDARARALVAAGEERFAAGDRDGAATRFAEATQLAPTEVDAWNDLAVAVSHRAPADAEELLRSALFIAPDDPSALANLAALGEP
ncbi:MAG TPA: glycosyltransferase [Baekduia sp.]|nr:glycosyltransferase [Baekduia sp.]